MSLGFTQGSLLTAGSSLDSATTAWINAVVAAGGAVSVTQQTRVNTLIVGLKADSLFTLLDRLYLFGGESDQFQATIDIINLGVATTHGTIPLTAAGYTGDGSSGYLSTTYNLSTAGESLTQDSAALGGYIITSRTLVNNSTLLGVFAPAKYTTIEVLVAGSLFEGEVNGATFPNAANANAQGSYTVSRTSSSAVAGYKNGSSVFSSGADTSSALPNAAMYMCCFNNNGTPGQFTADQVAAAWWGGGMDATQTGNLSTRVNTYMTAWGINVY